MDSLETTSRDKARNPLSVGPLVTVPPRSVHMKAQYYFPSDGICCEHVSDRDGNALPLVFGCSSEAPDTVKRDDSWSLQPPRRHGFRRPLHPQQLGAWVMILLINAFYWSAVRYPAGHGVEVVVVSCLVAVLDVAVLVLKIYLTLYDVTDYGDCGAMCYFCNRRVQADSKHCKACNRCASGFDHHCKWLNNCIGRGNYNVFLWFVGSVVVSTGFIAGHVTSFLVRFYNELSSWERAGSIIVTICVTFSFIMVSHLLGFHIFLRAAGYSSTYDYFVKHSPTPV